MKIFIKAAPLAAIVFLFCIQSASADDVQRNALENGLVALIKESHKTPLVAIEARVKTGSATEQGYLGSGISHFVEHMLFKGTKKRPGAGVIEKEIKALGGYTNGFTSHDSTGFQIIVPSEYVNNALEILKDVLTDPLFDPAEIKKERDVILKEIRLNRDEPSRYLSLLLWSNMFRVHNYRFPVIGYESLFLKLRGEDLVNYHKRYYVPDNIVLGISGDVNSIEVSKTIRDLFGGIERVSPTQVNSEQEPPQITNLEAAEEKEVALAYLSIGFHGVSVSNPDLFSLDVLSIILGGGEDSRLFKNLYRQKKVVYSIGSFDYTPKDPGIFAITAVLKRADCEKALNAIWSQIEDLKINPITDEELEKAKNQVLSAYIFSRQTVQDEVSDLVSGEMITGDYDFSRKYVEGIKTVSKEQVSQAARKYLRKENMTLIKLLPKAEPEKKSKEKQPGAPTAPKIEKFELTKNNLKILLLEDHTLPIISLNAVGLGGLRTENFKNNGISNLVSETLLCGTKKRSEDEIFSQVEGMGATMHSFSGSNTFGVSASCLSKNVDLVLEIFSDVLQNPEFDQEKVKREKAVTDGEIKSIKDNLYQAGIRTLKYVLFKRHPYRFQTVGRPSTINGFSQVEILAYYRNWYRPNNMVLAISGDIDKSKVKERLNTLFDKFEKSAPVKIKPPSDDKPTRPRVLSRNIEKEQSLVLLGYLGTTLDNHDEYVLEVLSSILSGINGRLSQKIREEKGLAYALDVGSIPGIERGVIIFYISTTKENLKIAKDALFEEIERLKNEGIRDEELRSAKNELIGLQRIGLQRSQDVAMRAALDELYGLGFNTFLKYEDRIRHITKECVLRAAKKYLNPNSYVLLLVKGTKEGAGG